MFQCLIYTCWKYITHTSKRKKIYIYTYLYITYCVGALRAFLCLPVSCHPPETNFLTSDYSHTPFLHVSPISPSIHPAPPGSFILSAYSCLLPLPLGSLHPFRQDLSSSAELQSAHRSAGCLERLTMTYQTPQTSNWSLYSTIILRPQPPPLFHLWLRCLDLQVPVFAQQGPRFSIINAHLHLCTQRMPRFASPLFHPPSLSLPFLFSLISHLSCKFLPTQLHWMQEACV